MEVTDEFLKRLYVIVVSARKLPFLAIAIVETADKVFVL
jgi:hypothetical protein